MPHSTLIEDKSVSSPPVPGAFDGIEKSAEIAVENQHLGGERPSLVGLTRPLLADKLKDIGVPEREIRMRASQLWHWIYHRGANLD
jgi:23S rRNA (adenine2503-C2)-methyltransferase